MSGSSPMPDLTRETLAELRRLNAERTQGEWKARAYGNGVCFINGFNDTSGLCSSHVVERPGKSEVTVEHRDYAIGPSSRGYPSFERYTGTLHPDAAIIALAINNLSALLAAAERGLGAGDGR